MRLETQDRERHTGLGVQVALCAEHVEMLGQDRRDHLLGRRLAVAARDTHHQRLDAAKGVRGERKQRLPAVGDDDLHDAGGNLRPPLHDHRGRAARDGIGDELVAVVLGAAEREEEPALPHLA